MPAAPFFALGLIMPIDVFLSVPPIALDAVRYGLAALIVFLVYSRTRPSTKVSALDLVALLLILSGGVAVFKEAFFGGSLFIPVVSLVSALVAYLVIKARMHHRWLLLGFMAGCALSGLDIISQAAGLPYLGMPSEYGFRYSGFSFSSTNVAPLLAVAACIAIMPWAWEKRRIPLRVILTVILVVSLFLSQGRVGVVGLLAAVFILALIYLWRRPLRTIVLLAVGAVVFWASGLVEFLTDYLTRSDTPGRTDFSSGRSELNADAWDKFWRSGMLGLNPAEYDLYNPHVAVLSSALNIGPFGLFATGLICILLAVMVFFAGRDVPVLFRMIAAIALTTSLIEPTGFFVGFAGAVLIMVCFAHYRGPSLSSLYGPQPAAPGPAAARQ